MKNKFNIGDIVYYIPKLSDFYNKTPLKISNFVLETHDILGNKLDLPVYLYSFEGWSLSAYENQIKKSGLTEVTEQNNLVNYVKLKRTGYFIGDTEIMMQKGKTRDFFYFDNYYVANIDSEKYRNTTEELKRRIEYYTQKDNLNVIDFVNNFITKTYVK